MMAAAYDCHRLSTIVCLGIPPRWYHHHMVLPRRLYRDYPGMQCSVVGVLRLYTDPGIEWALPGALGTVASARLARMARMRGLRSR